MIKPELLSPAGNLEKLKIAINYGADAVYGGVSNFSLRARSAREFSYESFKEAIDYTHSFGKKIYVTINGFPLNPQIKRLEDHIEKIAKMNPDAFIVATLGVIKLAKKVAPHIPLHLSTQANVLNYLDAQIYHELGVKRIVAARELGLKDLKEIKEKVPSLELEVFVHGSMCFAYSGRCLISSLQSGRVSNRGSCANDCRFPYTIYAQNPENNTLFKIEEDESGTYVMNAKDLNLAPHLDKILKEGIISAFKIEGRTKSPYYVAATARTYKKAIDDFYLNNFNPQDYKDELNTTKNRGFSDGYLVKRVFEKNDGQNLINSIEEGTHQVCALVSEDGKSFLAKDKIEKNIEYEIVLPKINKKIKEIDNDIGKIFYDENGLLKIILKSIITTNKKEMEEIHSGNLNSVILPCELQPFSFLRKKL